MRKTLHTPEQLRLVAILKQARLDRGLTQQAVADRLGVPQSFVAKYERAERRLDVVEFVAVVHALDADPLDLLRNLLRECEQTDCSHRH